MNHVYNPLSLEINRLITEIRRDNVPETNSDYDYLYDNAVQNLDEMENLTPSQKHYVKEVKRVLNKNNEFYALPLLHEASNIDFLNNVIQALGGNIGGGATKKKNVFNNQFKAWKKKNPSKRVNDLISFAHYVLAHPKEFRKITMNRAQSFANLSGGEMDGGKGNSFTRAFKKVGNSIKSTAEKTYDIAKPIAEKTYDIAKPIAIQGLKTATALGTNVLFDGLIDSGLTAIGQPELIPVTQVLTQPIKRKLNNLTDRAVDKYVVGSGIHKMKKQELKNVIKHYNRHTKGGKIKHGDLRKEQLRDIVQNLVGGGGTASILVPDNVNEEIQVGQVTNENGPVSTIADNVHVADAISVRDRLIQIEIELAQINRQISNRNPNRNRNEFIRLVDIKDALEREQFRLRYG